MEGSSPMANNQSTTKNPTPKVLAAVDARIARLDIRRIKALWASGDIAGAITVAEGDAVVAAVSRQSRRSRARDRLRYTDRRQIEYEGAEREQV